MVYVRIHLNASNNALHVRAGGLCGWWAICNSADHCIDTCELGRGYQDMANSDFRSGLNVFSDRYTLVQKQLTEIERQSSIRSRNLDRYRDLLDELIQIGMERAQYCSQWHEKTLLS